MGFVSKIKAFIDNLKKTLLSLINPFFWVFCVTYSLIFSYGDFIRIDTFARKLFYIIPSILTLAYFFSLKCNETFKFQDMNNFNFLLMGLVAYLLHRIVKIILTLLFSIPPLTLIGTITPDAVFALFSVIYSYIVVSIFYTCKTNVLNLFSPSQSPSQ